MGADEIRSTVLKSLREPLKTRGLHLVESGQRLRDENVRDRIDEIRGAWNSDNGDDPQRWLFRVLPDDAQRFVIKPLDVQGNRLGIASAKTGRGPTAAVVVRIGIFIASKDGEFQFQSDWVWLLWFVLAKPLPESVGNSARINRFDCGSKRVTFQETTVAFNEGGLVGVLDPMTQATTPAFASPITYGEVTNRLAAFIEAGVSQPDVPEMAEVTNRHPGSGDNV